MGGQTYGHAITKFLGWVNYHVFLGMGLRSRARTWSSAIMIPPVLFTTFEPWMFVVILFILSHSR